MLDFFLCHSSDDKDSFVRPLADYLINFGATVFYDEYSIKLGDSLFDTINKGIGQAGCGVIVISPSFLDKGWTNAELRSLFSLQLNGALRIIIIYHEITYKEVTQKYPLLADLVSTDSKSGIEKICLKLFEAIEKKPTVQWLTSEYVNDHVEEGVFFAGYLGLPVVGDKDVDKVVFELGRIGDHHSRLKLFLHKNERLYFEVTDSVHHKYALSMHWNKDEEHFILCNVDVQNSFVYFMVDGNVIDQISISNAVFENNFLNPSFWTFGCSLEKSYATPFSVRGLALGKSLSIEQANSMSLAMIKLNNATK